MKAVVLTKPNQFGFAEVPEPRLEPGDALVRVKACSLCGTDTRILEGKKTKGVRYPSIIGHEIAGIVEKIEPGGPNEAAGSAYKTGDRVAIAPVIPCHACRYCLEGRENACAKRRAIGYEYDGGFAELVRVPAAAVGFGHLARVPDRLGLAEAALAEPLACCLNGTRKAAVGIGDRCLILGAGPIGLMHAGLCRAAGAELVVVSEPNAERRARAAAFGADLALDPTAVDLTAEVKRLSGGEGMDVVIMAIGVPALINASLGLLRKGGRLNLFAGFPDKGEASIEANLIHYNEISVTGTSAATRLDYKQALELIASGRIDAAGLVTHRFPLERFGEAFALHKAGAGLKIVIEP